MPETLLTLATFFALLLPGIAVLRWLAPRCDRLTEWGVGSALGLVLLVARAMLLHRFGWFLHPERVRILELALVITAAIVAAAAVRRRHAPSFGWRKGGALFAVLGGSAVLRMIPHELAPRALQVPDAPQHCTMTTALLLTPGRATWEPFMNAPVHYPWGSHALVAEVHLLTGVPVWGTFSILLTAGLGVVTTMAVAAVAMRIWRQSSYALGSAYVYAFLSWADGVLFSRWGGLPTETSFALGLGLAAVMLAGGRIAWTMPFFVLGVLLTNHLIAGIVGVAFAFALAAVTYAFPDLRKGALLAIAGAALAGLVAVPVWLQVLNVDLADDTIAFSLRRHMDLWDMGHSHIGMYLVALAGVALFARRAPSKLGGTSILASIAALLTVFVCVFTLHKLYTGLDGTPEAVLVPSRWATALTYPLAIFSGGGAVALWDKLGGLRLVGAFALACSPIYPLWELSFRADVDRKAFEAFEYVRRISEPHDMVVSMVPRHDAWTNCVTRREANDVATPPGSDPLTRYAEIRRRLRPLIKRDADLPRALIPEQPRSYYLVVDTRRHRLRPSTRREPIRRFGHISVQQWKPFAP